MTEIEKKAEDYQTRISLGIDYSDFEEYNRAVNIFVHSIKQAYKDGYAQGQQEQNCVHCSNRSSELRKSKLDLQKENAELKAELSKMHKCSRCMSNGKDLNEMPCKNCLKDGVYTNWH